ncbi:MAG: hypothetical protein HYY65_04690 [Candidatus Tectomicrobia bacterium]|uniref:Nitrogenase iron protein n=1 Tax=Tectimicrobiota bacterium TaxID=2528274 RepID=A0A932GNR5_UNCTE|nr:hypothetical protein [Candidatus Tectomicrobia bacterium]
MRQISIYGKGGVGKSTVASNTSVALAEMGRRVMQMGCSPKADSTYLLLGHMCHPTVLDQVRAKGYRKPEYIDECLQIGHKGIVCAEAGGPEPALGCAGRGVLLVLELLRKYRLPEKHEVDFLVFDVIADVVCGGFAQPIRRGYAKETYIVTSGELMALYAANNICNAVKTMNELKGAQVFVGGLINNMRGVPGELELVREFGEIIGVPVVANIPHSDLMQRAETQKKTLVENFPDSAEAQEFRSFAQQILEPRGIIPQPLDPKDSISVIRDLLRKYQVFD